MYANERRQRWAAFSVRAHRDLRALASDVLLYDRLILPVQENDAEYDRWMKHDWEPGLIGHRWVQAAGHIIAVPWTAKLRAEWQDAYDQLRSLGREVAYGLTGHIYASSKQAWQEIYASVYTDDRPARKPFLIAGYQSEAEAISALELAPLSHGVATAIQRPGDRPVDRAVAMHIRRIVEEPDISDPTEAFLASVSLAEDAGFLAARRRLFDWEDSLYVDEWELDEIAAELNDIEEQYNAAVRDFARRTRRRRAASLLPGAAGHLATLSGNPHLKTPISKAVSFVVARRFTRMPSRSPDELPGHAPSLIRAAYRDLEVTTGK